MNCKNCSYEMFHPGGDAIEWACSWCGHIEWYPEFAAKYVHRTTQNAKCPDCDCDNPIDSNVAFGNIECNQCHRVFYFSRAAQFGSDEIEVR